MCTAGAQEDLIGHERERKGDGKRRAALHSEWLAQKDESETAKLMAAMRRGFRRPRGPAFLGDDVTPFVLSCMMKS